MGNGVALALRGGNTLPDSIFPEASEFGPLFILAIVLMAGAAGGGLAKRLRVPGITGNIVAGALLAYTLFRNIDAEQALEPLSTFAISLIAVTAGGHFSYRRIHNALKRILFVSAFEVAGAVTLVFVTLLLYGVEWQTALLLGSLAASTAPATTVVLIQENRAKGPLVKTLLASVSIDSSLCILSFAFVLSLLGGLYEHGVMVHGLADGLRQTGFQLAVSGLLGVGIGKAATLLYDHHRFHDFSVTLVAVLAAQGLSEYLGTSSLLTCLFMGVYLGNSAPKNEAQLTALEPVEPLLYTAFFTLAGTALHLDILVHSGLVCVLYIVARFAGKGLGAYIGATLAKASPRIRNNIGFGFMPQAGVALGLVVILQGDDRIPSEMSSYIATLVLAGVTLNEIIGPFFTRFALRRSGEAGLDRPRLVEFLDEEFILTDLEAKDQWEAIEKLTDFYARTHKLDTGARDALLATVVEREQDGSTAIGKGAAIPHGRVESGTAIQGVLGICPAGVDFQAYDGDPVHLIVLIVTPQDHEQRHLEVMASLSMIISNPVVRTRLAAATNANEAWEVIEGEEIRGINYFLNMKDEEPNGSVQEGS
jgi:fructose PTS system EIIBC or EIIC component